MAIFLAQMLGYYRKSLGDIFRAWNAAVEVHSDPALRIAVEATRPGPGRAVQLRTTHPRCSMISLRFTVSIDPGTLQM